ncbi:MAG: hypothetical protein R8F63_06020 [Acidimicrobiales bacterium]|nr:hypothetical protein [Acidimicrobiales bacterium]
MAAIANPDSLTDDELIRAVSEVLSVDRTLDNSFVLHSPLELLARADLLKRVSPAARDGARARLVSLAEIHHGSGDPIPLPEMPGDGDVDVLLGAIGAGDVDRADAIAMALLPEADVADVCRLLAPATVRAAAAAAHAPILLGNWPRTTAHASLDPRFVRGIVRRLTRSPDVRFDLPHPNASRQPGSAEDLDAALRSVPRLGSPGWGIYALVQQAESSGLMADMPAIGPAGVDVDDAFRVLFRVAATSMVLGDEEAAPYEWTHCLSLPIGVWLSARAHADPHEALDVAVTHVVGFRAAFGDGALGRYEPAAPESPLGEALDEGPAVAAAAAFHAPDHADAMALLIDAVAGEHDAHLVKYVHAALDATAADPANAALYRAAAAHLAAWWRQNPPDDDPLA